MSTFTDWNGPQGSNVRANDLAEMALRYQSMLSELQAHINANPSSTNVHSIKDYIEPLLQECVKFEDLTNKLTAYAKLEQIPRLDGYVQRSELNQFATQSDITDFVRVNTLSSYLMKDELEGMSVIQRLKDSIASIQAFINGQDIAVFDSIVKTNQYFEGLVNAVEQVKFTDKIVHAYIGGSDDLGVYYILGMLLDKAGTVYIKYVDDKPFSAVVNFAVTSSLKGTINVITDATLKDLNFKIVTGTDKDGNQHAYLAIQSSEWIPQFASTDGKGMFNNITFEIGGINFVPVESNGWKPNNGSCEIICKSSRFLLFNDIKKLDIEFEVIGWDEYNDEGIAINVPYGYHACDGTEVLDTDDVSDEFREKYDNYPLIDYHIIKVKALDEASL